MKSNYIFSKILVLVVFINLNSWSQETIVQWNFNGTSSTTVPGGELSPLPIIGNGTATLIGGVTATFASGISSGGSTDPVTTSPENFGWNTSNYAPLGTDNKMRGVQFNVSTINYKGITFKFDQRLSNTSNNTYVVQYTTDNSISTPVWIDAQTFTFPPGTTNVNGGDVWYNSRTVSLSDITSLNNNPNVGFRVVSAFDPNSGDYLAATETSTYATTGTSRFDMVTISGESNLATTTFESNQNNLIIYPNPTEKIVYLNKDQNIKIFDTLGKLILDKKNTNNIDVSNFKPGIYFIKTESGISKKLIIK